MVSSLSLSTSTVENTEGFLDKTMQLVEMAKKLG
jgi:hypothetical protein